MEANREKYDIATSQRVRLESGEWSVVDRHFMPDMLDYNLAAKEHNFQNGLTIRTKIDSAVGPRSPEVPMAGSGEIEIKVEDEDESPNNNAGTYRFPTVEDEYVSQMTAHAEHLRNALNATAMAEDDGQTNRCVTQEGDVISLVGSDKIQAQDTNIKPEIHINLSDSYKIPNHFSTFTSSTTKPDSVKTKYTPKTRFDANEYLYKIKSRFQTQPGIYTTFIHLLKAHRASPSRSPSHTQQTHAAVRKLFWPHADLIWEFGEWLPLGAVGDEGV